MISVTSPTFEVAWFFNLWDVVNSFLFSFCLSVCHVFYHDLIVYKVQRFLQSRSWVLDKQSLLHGGAHCGYQAEAEHLVLSHARESTVSRFLSEFKEPRLEFLVTFPFEGVSRCLQFKCVHVVLLEISLLQDV